MLAPITMRSHETEVRGLLQAYREKHRPNIDYYSYSLSVERSHQTVDEAARVDLERGIGCGAQAH